MDGREITLLTIEPRTMLWAVAEVTWEDSGEIHKLPATLEDTSLSGACVRVKRPFSVGSKVMIRWHREQFSAVTKNCRNEGRDFLLGLQRDPAGNEVSSTSTSPAEFAAVATKSSQTSQRLSAAAGAHSGENPRQHSGTNPPPDHERTDMQSNNFIPQFLRRQQSGEASDKAAPMEALMNKPFAAAAEINREQRYDLLSYDDIYRAAGIMSTRSGYGIHKVVEMLNSERIRDLPPDAKRASVLMALDAAGTSVDELRQDAVRRQSALDAYEAGQRKQVEEFDAHMNAENARIEAEMEQIRVHYAERMQNNRDQVTREKEALHNWQMAMQHESQRISEVIDLCGKELCGKELCGKQAASTSLTNAAATGTANTVALDKPEKSATMRNSPMRPTLLSGD
jgi:hypothetical protein